MRDRKNVVLYLEDDEEMRSTVAVLLRRRLNCEVLEAGDSQVAFQLLAQHGAVIDVVLSDHNLLGAETSSAFLKHAKETLPDVPRILLSASVVENIANDFAVHGLALRDVRLVTKGVSGIRDIQATLSEVLSGNGVPSL